MTLEQCTVRGEKGAVSLFLYIAVKESPNSISGCNQLIIVAHPLNCATYGRSVYVHPAALRVSVRACCGTALQQRKSKFMPTIKQRPIIFLTNSKVRGPGDVTTTASSIPIDF
jgi:hypothetical protein